MRRTFLFPGSFMAILLCVAFDAPAGQKESAKKKPPVDPELAAFQKQLDEMPLSKLKELYATEFNGWVRWRQQNNLGSGCQLNKGFAATKEKEKELVAKCQALQQKVHTIERTIKAREKSSPERQAIQQQLDSLSIAKLRELQASETQAYDRWREQNHLDGGCRLGSKVAMSKEKEAELVAKCEEWKQKVETIKAAIGRREPAPRGKYK